MSSMHMPRQQQQQHQGQHYQQQQFSEHQDQLKEEDAWTRAERENYIRYQGK